MTEKTETSDNVLVYFDTNTLRSTSDGEVVYNVFNLSTGFNRAETYLTRINLCNNVKLAISEIVVRELQEQKIAQYNSDVEGVHKLAEVIRQKYRKLVELDSKVSELTNLDFIDKAELKLTSYSFDYSRKMLEMSDSFFSGKNIEIIKVPQENNKKAIVFDKIIERAILKKDPFQQGKVDQKNFSDAGFKDVLIWESLLNYTDINLYGKVIFVTNDSVFERCKDEFEEMTDITFDICHDFDELIEKLEVIFIDYLKETPFTDYLDNEQLFDHIYDDYFEDYIQSEISKLDEIIIDGQRFPIIGFSFVNRCLSIDNYEGDIEQDDLKSIISEIEICYEDQGSQKKKIFNTEVLMDDTGGLEYLFEIKMESE